MHRSMGNVHHTLVLVCGETEAIVRRENDRTPDDIPRFPDAVRSRVLLKSIPVFVCHRRLLANLPKSSLPVCCARCPRREWNWKRKRADHADRYQGIDDTIVQWIRVNTCRICPSCPAESDAGSVTYLAEIQLERDKCPKQSTTGAAAFWALRP
jgi:hypothetical protein